MPLGGAGHQERNDYPRGDPIRCLMEVTTAIMRQRMAICRSMCVAVRMRFREFTLERVFDRRRIDRTMSLYFTNVRHDQPLHNQQQ